MREYLIRAIDDEESDMPYPKWSEVLRPKSYPSKVIEGWGALRLEVEGCEVSFSPEPPGTQVVFERGEIPAEAGDAIMRGIPERAESFTGQKGKVVPLQWG